MAGIRARRLAADHDRWWMMGAPRVRTNATRLLAPAAVWHPALLVNQLVFREGLEVTTLDNIIETLGVTAHGIDIFPSLPSTFYNAYMPIRYTENTMVVSPVDMAPS